MARGIDAYLGRIGLTAGPPTLEGQGLMSRHPAAIPYEISTSGWSRRDVAVPAIYDKIVGRRRGGGAYELNGLFGWALGELEAQLQGHARPGAVMHRGRH